ncbi:MAG: hypothetical protein FWG50_10710 [Kiritimatiellaeota bacterium]|nr:hypothetical protein [Kiritimatiellota bacterium]
MVTKKKMTVVLAVTVALILLLLRVLIIQRHIATTGHFGVEHITNATSLHVENTSTENKNTASGISPALAALVTNSIASSTGIGVAPDSAEVAEYVRIAHAKASQVGGKPDDIAVDNVVIKGETIIVSFLHRSLASLKKVEFIEGARYPKGEGELMTQGATIWGATVTIDIKTKTVLRVDQ